MVEPFVDLSGILNVIPTHYESWAAFLIIFCKLITVFTPPPEMNSWLYRVYKVISLLGLNVGWATNCIVDVKEKGEKNEKINN
ncbi:hypothetical protein [Neokomagataea thailandica]|uniref:Uncharacterized protein n=1 Tax=Neokomagataea tanensis NBRC 106556 TaxID=1223519 RepID=A0ABQ0QH57_9PROT|nr:MULTISPECIES: hypothetical protein [Neokomagataea]GBR44595.1 hypothetical protein AA106556_0478 [Neokomagataea tanensis NBRC 106556]